MVAKLSKVFEITNNLKGKMLFGTGKMYFRGERNDGNADSGGERGT